MMKTYSECIALPTFKERFEYLMLKGNVGDPTLANYAFLKSRLYNSSRWRRLKRDLIVRDLGCDLASEGHELKGRIVLHHINPVFYEDYISESPKLYDPENLICCSHMTHEAIHYSDYSIICDEPIVRYPNDTVPWKR